MAKEVETKVLGVDSDKLRSQLQTFGAKLVLDTKLSVDWFRYPEVKEGEDQWYLRVRSTSDGETEVTWKGKSEILGAARSHPEINLGIDNQKKMRELLQAIGLSNYAHQDKLRTSWTLADWHFDLDRYPGMPPYLEIEGKDEGHIQEALRMLQLEQYETSSQGERVLIQTKYGLNWYVMRF